MKYLKLFTIEFLVALLLCALPVILFAMLADEVVIEQEDIFDARMFDVMRTIITPLNTKIALFITFFGSGAFLIPAYLLIIAYCITTRQPRLAVMTGVIGLVSTISVWVLKDIFHRSRPLTPLVEGVGGYSFPSGHSLGGFTFFGVIIYLIFYSKVSKPSKYVFAVLAFLFGVMIGLSRIYLHVHFASDVAGSLFVALTWLSLFGIVHKLTFLPAKAADQ